MLTLDQALEEIESLPVGQKISTDCAKSILSWYSETESMFDIVDRNGQVYKQASDYEKLCLDHLRDFIGD